MTEKRGSKDDAAKAGKRSVDEVIAAYPGDVREIAEHLRRRVRVVVPGVTEAVKWGNPVFEYRGRGLCYVQGHKDYLRFGFFEHGAELDDPDRLLEGAGKGMRHIKLRGEADIPPILDNWLLQAVSLIERQSAAKERS